MKMKDKKQSLGIVISLIGLVIIVLAVSYAMFQYGKQGQKLNMLTSGSVSLILNEGNEINLENAYPLTDSEGLEMTGYDFTLENNGTTGVNYEIYLDNVAVDDTDVKLDDSFIKYSLDKDGVKGQAKYLTSLGADQNRIIDTGTINVGEEYSYILRVWVTTEIDADIQGQVWKGKLRLIGEQIS